MSSFERPGPDLAKITEAWTEWETGAELLPGRTMADLKIGGTDLVLTALAEDTEPAAQAHAAWAEWERGKLGPADALTVLAENGFGALVAALVAAA